MNNLYLMVGAPGSGKSTYANNFINTYGKPIKVVSRDAIRFSLLNDGAPYFSKEKDVFSKFTKEINEGVEKGE